MNTRLILPAALAALVTAAPAHAASTTVTRAWQYQDASAAGLELDNLIGDVRVERGVTAGFYVSATVTAEADSAGAAEALARAVEFRSRDAGGASLFQVRFPESHFARIYWPDAPRGLWAGRVHVRYLGERRRLTGDPDEGARIRVDLLVRVPDGARLTVRNRFGDSMADGVTGDVTLDGTRGRAVSTNGSGRLRLDTGSGRAEVARHEGEVRADTGSGPVNISGCRCRIEADSGSGGIRVVDSEGELLADTGSGSVTVRNFTGSVRADTGSGRVHVTGLTGAKELVADTGSGSVSVAGDLSRLEALRIDTGSGGVVLEATAWPSMAITVDTGSGGVRVDVPGADVSRNQAGQRVVRLGEATARGLIDTGSGSVRLRTVAATVP